MLHFDERFERGCYMTALLFALYAFGEHAPQTYFVTLLWNILAEATWSVVDFLMLGKEEKNTFHA